MSNKKTLRVLLVEDSVDDAALLMRELKRSEYEIQHKRVDTPEEMTEAMKDEWDIIISDYAMPKFGALEALALLKRSGRDLPFLIVSGTIGEDTAVQAMKAGAHDYLMKDNLMRLIPAVERELREAKVRTNRAQSELALYQSEEKFRFIFEHNPVPMWILAGDTHAFLEVNEAAVIRYGYARSEFIKMTMDDLKVASNERSILAMGHRMVGEEKHRIKDGETIDVEIHADTLEFGGKKLILIIAQDITHRKQIEQELIQARETALEASRLKSEFLANVSHEIRTPLNGIIGVTGFLLNSEISHKEKSWLDIIRVSGDSLLNIVNQILDFSKMESGKLEFERVSFNLMNLVKETVNVFSYAAKNKGIKLEIVRAPNVPLRLEGDPVRLRQVLINLIDNAIKFTKEGAITVKIENKNVEGSSIASLRISVQDTGIGVQEQSRRRLFHPFSQADSSATRKYGGTGLGLAICEKIVTLMGGEIGFDSEWGKGSNFWFTLNLKKLDRLESDLGSVQNVEAATEPQSPARLSVNGKHSQARILVAEDNLVNKKVIVEMVKNIGYKVDGVDDGEKAVKAIDKKKYDLVLMDCQMPKMNGYEATARIREKEKQMGRRTPIVAVTAHVMKGDRDKCIEAGMDDYISKPIDMEQLSATLRKWISKGSHA